MAPDLRPYFSTGHHDDERGITTTYLLGIGSHLQTWSHFLVTTPTIVATVDAAVATAIVVLAGLRRGPDRRRRGRRSGRIPGHLGSTVLPPTAEPNVLRHARTRFPTPPGRSLNQRIGRRPPTGRGAHPPTGISRFGDSLLLVLAWRTVG